jgi:F420-dependent oxidoreductase-like protein
MDLRIMTEPQQGASYEDQLAVAQTAEAAGFGAFFRSDHFLAMSGTGDPGPTDSWVTLAGIARETSTIRLGTLVTSATFRLPGLLAIQVAQVDAMSGGRVELGLGTGWFEAEHTAYGFPFPPLGERFDRLEEQLEIVTGLWGTPPGSQFSYSGKHYTLTDSPALPKPAQATVPIIIGGSGPTRTPRLAARFAAEFNCLFIGPDEARTRYARVAEACAEAGREQPPLSSIMLPFAVGRTDAEVTRRAEARGTTPSKLREAGITGTVEEAVDTLGRYAEAGVERVYLQHLDLPDLAQLELIGTEVLPQVA